MHAISAVKGFVRYGGDEEVSIEGMPTRVEAGRSENVGCRERERKMKIETERSWFLCIFMVMVYFYDAE